MAYDDGSGASTGPSQAVTVTVLLMTGIISLIVIYVTLHHPFLDKLQIGVLLFVMGVWYGVTWALWLFSRR